MIGSLVSYLYNENDPDNLFVIVLRYGKELLDSYMNEEDEELFLVYDFKHNEYFYAMLNELSFFYLPEEK